MIRTTVVTSCSAEGWRQYGERFTRTFNQYWPEDIDLHIVSEDELVLLLPESEKRNRRIILWPLLQQSDVAARFLERHANHSWVHGDAGDPDRPRGTAAHWRPNSGKHCFRHDAYKFCKKVFAIELVAEFLTIREELGRLLWIDADAVTFAQVPETLAERMLPKTYAVSCLARQGYHSECGFVGYNLDNPAALHFIRSFSALYGSDEVFKLAEWHDSWVFDWLRNKLMTPTYEIPHRSKSHPFINSELGRYLDHLKGSRKKQGRSIQGEQIGHRDVPYWRTV